MVTNNSGADAHYLSEQDRARTQLPILRRSTKFVGVANGDTSRGTYVTRLPVWDLPDHATEANTFKEFPHSLMSVGKTADTGTIFIFTRETPNRPSNGCMQYQMDACGMRVPSQINSACRSPSRQLHRLATTHGPQCQKSTTPNLLRR